MLTTYQKHDLGFERFVNVLSYSSWNLCLNDEPEPYLLKMKIPCNSAKHPHMINYLSEEKSKDKCYSAFAGGDADCESECLDTYNYRDDLFTVTLEVIPDTNCV